MAAIRESPQRVATTTALIAAGANLNFDLDLLDVGVTLPRAKVKYVKVVPQGASTAWNFGIFQDADRAEGDLFYWATGAVPAGRAVARLDDYIIREAGFEYRDEDTVMHPTVVRLHCRIENTDGVNANLFDVEIYYTPSWAYPS